MTYRIQRNPPQIPLLNFLSYLLSIEIYIRVSAFTVFLHAIYLLSMYHNKYNKLYSFLQIDQRSSWLSPANPVPSWAIFRECDFDCIIPNNGSQTISYANAMYASEHPEISQIHPKKKRDKQWQFTSQSDATCCTDISLFLFLSFHLFMRANEVQKVKFIGASKILCTRIPISPKLHFYNATQSNK